MTDLVISESPVKYPIESLLSFVASSNDERLIKMLDDLWQVFETAAKLHSKIELPKTLAVARFKKAIVDCEVSCLDCPVIEAEDFYGLNERVKLLLGLCHFSENKPFLKSRR